MHTPSHQKNIGGLGLLMLPNTELYNIFLLQHRYKNKLVFENVGLPPGCSIPPSLYCYYGSNQFL